LNADWRIKRISTNRFVELSGKARAPGVAHGPLHHYISISIQVSIQVGVPAGEAGKPGTGCDLRASTIGRRRRYVESHLRPGAAVGEDFKVRMNI
jgi:hypothetical protein